MIDILDEKRIYKSLDKYFDVLSKRGYIGKDIVLKQILWLFLYDFVNTIGRFMKECDYNRINSMLSHLFNCDYCFFGDSILDKTQDE